MWSLSKKTWKEKLDDALWDFIYGEREKKWNPDRRPAELQGKPFNYETSTLSWGRWEPEELKIEESEITEAVDFAEEPTEDKKEKGEADSLPILATEQLDKNDPMRQRLDEQLAKLADFDQIPSDEKERMLSGGRQLAELCFSKYERYHDMSVYYSDPFGKDQRQVAFNVYGAALGDRSFPMTEEQYLGKLEYICQMLNAWDQAWYVKQFMMEPPIARRGLPSKPKWDTAVTLRLNKSPTWKYLDLEKIKEFIAKDN